MTKQDEAELDATKKQMADLYLTIEAMRAELSDAMARSIDQRKAIAFLRSQQDQTG